MLDISTSQKDHVNIYDVVINIIYRVFMITFPNLQFIFVRIVMSNISV